jgi:arylsulfate sulfotransferase
MNSFLRSPILFSLTIEMLLASTSAHALTILSGPSFAQATNAPLAGVLQLTTDVPSRLSVSVNDGTTTWERRFYDYATNHAVPLLGFKPGRSNAVTVTVHDRRRNQVTAAQPLNFATASLPADFPAITLLHSEPAKMEPGYTLFRIGVHNELYWYVTIVDSAGEVVWYGASPSTADVRQLANGNLFMPWTNRFVELNLLGQEVNSWIVPTNLPINVHDGVPTSHGTILYLSDGVEVVTNYPTSMTNSNGPRSTVNIRYQNVVEISATNAALLHTWTPINFLDPRRITYMIDFYAGAWDTEHSNAVSEDPRDDTLIMSMRMQSSVLKFSRATGQLKWILGPPENWGPAWQPYLLTPVGSPFGWQYAQHAPIITAQGTLMLFDNGNFRAIPFNPPVPDSNNYTRAVEFSIDEQTMQISQVWDCGRTNVTDRLYVDHEGYAEPEPKTGNVLIDYSAVNYSNGVPPSPYGPTAWMVRIQEVTHEVVPQIVFDLAISMYGNTAVPYKDCTVYRAQRISDLYAHPPQPVADLSAIHTNGAARLAFSADNARSYIIQASTNLVNWQAVGAASEVLAQSGNFAFEESSPGGQPARFYRVVTQ